ncbi:isocitrate lyase/phosphoenolpyruvate mutase family protein [Rhizobiaceae bacterium n13]|uniref:Isocitrate lyase/phosphoenolpyruvate mutase family protein n=1 Tax=Ferirhizobium litorale TaxID=2927786 RepID=A0AAE3QG66_9HYPH|nr:isocitrate lyase/phosphoenolpyruvate mutase family protein [Fererhizobium litorale]MDI7862193.1 isocitrate lyase/phosphoenolpyruvate mutase family protein [Fererhizobium litorale]MDI7922533.1 isocitrate lyase/phosphoenolpyruvate mutase family protein [Fererhizobium litorale]
MDQVRKAQDFASLHRKGRPVVLYNIWDAGSARCVAEAGAKAIATGSWSVAAAQGFADGQEMPLLLLVDIARSIIQATELPVTIDFEGGYAQDPAEIALNAGRIMDVGAVGINIEDQVVGGNGIHAVDRQAACIEAIREAADHRGIPFFINARTDFFLRETDPVRHSEFMDEAIARAKAYADAGANGFFAPGLADERLIRRLCAEVALPVNIMMRPGAPTMRALSELGVARISHGPFPYREMMRALRTQAEAIYHHG